MSQDQSLSLTELTDESNSQRTPTETTSPPQYSQLAVPSTSATHQHVSTSASQDEQDGILQFDIVPRSDASSFQAGYQGLQQRGFEAWLRGDVLIKQSQAAATQSSQSSSPKSRFSQCTVELLATESIQTSGRLVVHQLHHSSLTLWTSPSIPGPSNVVPSTSSSGFSTLRPPTVMPFQFSLPEDLPHCVHLPNVKIEYRIVATLHPMQDDPLEQQPLTRSILVHLTRYTPPSDTKELIPAALVPRFSDKPKEWNLVSPTPVNIRLVRTLYRRAEPIKIKVRVPPPDEALVDKGLRIRSVEAELIRVVKPRMPQSANNDLAEQADKSKGKQTGTPPPSQGSNGPPSLHRHATIDGWEPHTHLLYAGEENGESSAQASQILMGPSNNSTNDHASHSGAQDLASSSSTTSATTNASETPPQPSSTILSYSGKSCRFSMHRPLVLHLLLVPPFKAPALPHPSPDHDAPPLGVSPLSAGAAGGGGGCESVSQQTTLSSVHFLVRVSVRLRGRSNQDTTSSTSNSTEQRSPGSQQDITVEQDVFILPGLAGQLASDETPGDTDNDTDNDAQPHTVPGAAGAASSSDAEEEFDGYEDFRDINDSFDEMTDQHPSHTLESGDASQSAASRADENAQRPPSFEESSHQLSASAVMNLAVGTPGFLHGHHARLTTSRRQEQGEDLPPNVEESRNDLRIFPTHDETEDDVPPPPPSPPPPPAAVHSGAQSALDASLPPSWLRSTLGSSEMISGVGTGQRRTPGQRTDALHNASITASGPSSARSPTPPPEFQALRSQHHPPGLSIGLSDGRESGSSSVPLLRPDSEYTPSSSSVAHLDADTSSRLEGTADPPPYAHGPHDVAQNDGLGSLTDAEGSQSASTSSGALRPVSLPSAAEEKALLAATYAANDGQGSSQANSNANMQEQGSRQPSTAAAEWQEDQQLISSDDSSDSGQMTPVLSAANPDHLIETSSTLPPSLARGIRRNTQGLPPAYYAGGSSSITGPDSRLDVQRLNRVRGIHDRGVVSSHQEGGLDDSDEPATPPPPISPLPIDSDEEERSMEAGVAEGTAERSHPPTWQQSQSVPLTQSTSDVLSRHQDNDRRQSVNDDHRGGERGGLQAQRGSRRSNSGRDAVGADDDELPVYEE
ncbi:unnamed protein product [Sympodiomycopsis kandeliae]